MIVYYEKPLPKSRFPSVHDFNILWGLRIKLLAFLDEARTEVDSYFVSELLFRLRGFVFEEMENIIEYVRPRE